MRRSPEYAPNHKDLEWIEFVTTPWSPEEFVPPKTIKHCQFNFTSLDVAPCEPSQNENILYELRNDHSGYPYNSIVELRADKIKDLMSLQNDHVFIPMRYECLMEGNVGFEYLTHQLSREMNIPSQCSTSGASNRQDDYFSTLVSHMESEIGLHPACVDDEPTYDVKEEYEDYKTWMDKYDVKEQYEDYKTWMNKYVDWDVEKLIGYHEPKVKSEGTSTGIDLKNDMDLWSKSTTVGDDFSANEIDSSSKHEHIPTFDDDFSTNEVDSMIDNINKKEIGIPTTSVTKLPIDSKTGPKLAWLLTFPHSSTLYTVKLISKASNTLSVTNYGNSYLNNYESVPLYKDSPGPYVWSPSDAILDERLKIPNSYILTQTHCGSQCFDCPPKEYIEDVDKFLKECLQAPKVVSHSKASPDQNPIEIQVTPDISKVIVNDSYDSSSVKKIIHVVKCPFASIVSSFHAEYKTLSHKFENEGDEKYSNDKTGFQKYCKDQDQSYKSAEYNAYGEMYGIGVYLLTKNVPCHADFYRYVQWHNLAFEMEEKLNASSFIFNYEDYKDKLQDTLKEMLDFLELPLVDNDLVPFDVGISHDHYTKEQAESIQEFIEALASDKTWKYVCRYFNSC